MPARRVQICRREEVRARRKRTFHASRLIAAGVYIYLRGISREAAPATRAGALL